MKKIIYYPHARERMAERDVTEKDVEYALYNPNINLPAKKQKAARRRIMNEIPERGTLRIICKETSANYFIISVAWETGGK